MNTSWHSYPKVFALGHRAISDLFRDEVLVEEKVDGSQFSFGRFGGELKCRSKGAQLNTEYPEAMFKEAVEVARTLDVVDGYTYRGEYLKVPKHNSLAYDRIPHNHIIIFDINIGEEEYLDYDAKYEEAERIGLECVPILRRGVVDSPTDLLELLSTPSVLGGQKVEGVVIKNYNRFGEDKKALMGKYVSEAFKEVHGKEWRENNPQSKDIVARLIIALKTPARWNKAVQHLRERGELTDSPKDIGALLKEVQTDTMDECADMIRDELFKYAAPHIRRGIIGGLPEWYKEELMKRQFENVS